MCGGAVISDADPLFNQRRKLTANDLWSEFNTSDLFGWDIKPQTVQFAATEHEITSKTKKFDNKGIDRLLSYF